MKDHQTMWNKA